MPPLRCHAGLGPKHSTKGADTSGHGEQKASALARAHLTEKSIGSCFRVISGKSRTLLDRRKLDFRVRTICFRCLGKVRDLDQWEIRTWELLAGEVGQLGGQIRIERRSLWHTEFRHQDRWILIWGLVCTLIRPKSCLVSQQSS